MREELGADRVSALMTTTEASIDRPEQIIDAYLEQGLHEVFLRPLSPYGFAVKTRSTPPMTSTDGLSFYERGLDYILALNDRGVEMRERYAAIVLKKMLTNSDPRYVDLTSPAGIGIAALAYNYDGDVYASDEGRMLAEMNDTTFRLGNVHTDSYEDMLLSDALLSPVEDSFTGSAPCVATAPSSRGAAPTPSSTTPPKTTQSVTKRGRPSADATWASSRFSSNRYETDPRAREIFRSWAAG